MKKHLIIKYKGFLLYVVFGVATTVVNIAVYWLAAYLMQFGTILSTVVAWGVAVLFAYFTNRKWVFQSLEKSLPEVMKEIVSFFVCRLATGVIDLLCMYIFVDVLKFNDVMIKVSTNILVIILNYVASKLFVFKRI